jgi:hypothetical protein
MLWLQMKIRYVKPYVKRQETIGHARALVALVIPLAG